MWSLVKEGGGVFLLLDVVIFRGQLYALTWSWQFFPSWKKLQQVMDVPSESTAEPLDAPQHLHPTSSHSVPLDCPYNIQKDDNCLRVTSEKAIDQLVGYHGCPTANIKNSNKTLFSSVCMAG